MLLKVLMDFCSLKIRDKPHAPTHTQAKRNLIIIIIKQNNKTTIQQQGRTFSQVHAFDKNQKAITKLFQ